MDQYLAAFVRWASAQKDAHLLGITMTVGGVVVTGNVVSESAYFEGLATRFDIPVDTLEEVLGRSDAEGATQGFLHLSDAKIQASNTGAPMIVGWWRAPLEAVDGFAIGGLVPPED